MLFIELWKIRYQGVESLNIFLNPRIILEFNVFWKIPEKPLEFQD